MLLGINCLFRSRQTTREVGFVMEVTADDTYETAKVPEESLHRSLAVDFFAEDVPAAGRRLSNSECRSDAVVAARFH